MNRLARRSTPALVRAAIGLVALLVVLVTALQGDAATTLVVGVLALLAFAAWWRRHATVAACTLSLALTLLATSATTEWAAERSPLVSAVQSGLVFWLFAGVVAGVVWWVPDRGRGRVVTTALAHAVLVAASLFVTLAPSSAPIVGLCAAMALVWWRSRRRRPRRRAGGVVTDGAGAVDPAEESRGVRLTREALSVGLSDDWHLYGDWVLPEGGGVVESLMIGPGGVFVVETRDWPGSVDLVDVEEGQLPGSEPSQAYALDGDPRELVARLAPSAHKVRPTAGSLGVEAAGVTGVVVFWGETSLPGDIAELTMLSGPAQGRPPGSGSQDVQLFLIRGERLAGWLSEHPVRLDAEQVTRFARRQAGPTSVR